MLTVIKLLPKVIMDVHRDRNYKNVHNASARISVKRKHSETKKGITMRLKRCQNKTKRMVLNRINVKVVMDENVVRSLFKPSLIKPHKG